MVATTTEATTWGRNKTVRKNDIPRRALARVTMMVSPRARVTGTAE